MKHQQLSNGLGYAMEHSKKRKEFEIVERGKMLGTERYIHFMYRIS